MWWAGLSSIHVQGPYVLVMLTTGKTGTSYLKGAWLIAAYRSLSRPFRKNVKFILLVKPSNGIRALLLLFKPFVSRKAHSKLKRVRDSVNPTCSLSLSDQDNCRPAVLHTEFSSS